jgi:hypothetical protein
MNPDFKSQVLLFSSSSRAAVSNPIESCSICVVHVFRDIFTVPLPEVKADRHRSTQARILGNLHPLLSATGELCFLLIPPPAADPPLSPEPSDTVRLEQILDSLNEPDSTCVWTAVVELDESIECTFELIAVDEVIVDRVVTNASHCFGSLLIVGLTPLVSLL